jgi:hypothetical protein
MKELHDSAVQERSNPVVPGESPGFRFALKKLQDLGESTGAFSKAALGEIRRTIAMVDTMNLPLDPASIAGEKQKAYVKETLPARLAERKTAFDAISQTDCGTA